ncbi:MAG TPA: hypothetical protein VKY80_09085 [Croceibacterium sp.]|nr:hypothetical protein [Croceibacterium sp.]
MAHQPTPAEIRSFAIRHGVTDEQAKRMLTDHGPNEDGWDETARSLLHFLKAPS